MPAPPPSNLATKSITAAQRSNGTIQLQSKKKKHKKF